jgi:hypothetical protein
MNLRLIVVAILWSANAFFLGWTAGQTALNPLLQRACETLRECRQRCLHDETMQYRNDLPPMPKNWRDIDGFINFYRETYGCTPAVANSDTGQIVACIGEP